MNEESWRPKLHRRGFPLGMLFLLMALCAVFASVLATAVQAFREGVDSQTAIGSGIGMTVVLSTLGMLIGVGQSHRIRGGCLGSLTGAMLGGLIGPLVVLNGKHALSTFIVCSGGSVLMIVIAASIRHWSRDDLADLTPLTGSQAEPFLANTTTSETISADATEANSTNSA